MKREMKKEVKLNPQQVLRLYEQERQRLDELNQRLQGMASYYQDLKAAEDSIKEIREAKGDAEIILPLGAGINVSARVSDKNSLKVMRNNIAVEKTSQEVLEDIKSRKEKAERAITDMEANLEQMFVNIEQFSRALKMQQKMSEKKED